MATTRVACREHPDKAYFPTFADAERRLAEIIANPMTDKIPSRIYVCPDGEGDPAREHWHMTSDLLPPLRIPRAPKVRSRR